MLQSNVQAMFGGLIGSQPLVFRKRSCLRGAGCDIAQVQPWLRNPLCNWRRLLSSLQSGASKRHSIQ